MRLVDLVDLVDGILRASRNRFLSGGPLGTVSGLRWAVGNSVWPNVCHHLLSSLVYLSFLLLFRWCLLALGGHLARQVHGTGLASQGFLVRCNTGSRVVGK